MHNLFLTDTVDQQIHTMKPGTSSLRLTCRCTTKAVLHRAVFRATLMSWKYHCTLSSQDNTINHCCCLDHLDSIAKHFLFFHCNSWQVKQRHRHLSMFMNRWVGLLYKPWCRTQGTTGCHFCISQHSEGHRIMLLQWHLCFPYVQHSTFGCRSCHWALGF